MADADTILIIGAGQAGAVAAATLRELGHEGAITLVGQEAHAPYERPPLSKDALQTADAHGRTSVHPEDFYERQRITLLTGTEVASTPAAIADWPTAAICPTAAACWRPAGGRANCPGLPRGTPGVHYIRTLDDAALRAGLAPQTRVAVIGGGFLAWKWRPRARALGPKSPSWKARRACWSACCPRHCRTGWPNAPATPAWTCAWARALPADRQPQADAAVRRQARFLICRMPAPWRPTSWWWPSA